MLTDELDLLEAECRQLRLMSGEEPPPTVVARIKHLGRRQRRLMGVVRAEDLNGYLEVQQRISGISSQSRKKYGAF